MIVTPVAVRVRGRARLHVRGLRGRPLLAARLENGLTASGAVRVVRASAITGNVLVLFDARRLTLRHLVDDVARHATDASLRPGAPPRARAARRAGAAERGRAAWHALPGAVVAERLHTAPATGLTADEAKRRLAAVGANRLPVPVAKTALEIVAGHVTSLPVVLLGGAAALSLAVGALVDAGVILAVVAANAVVGYVTESRVERILSSLQNGTVPPALVRRAGREVTIDATALVPGDVVILKPGHAVAADARLLESDRLTVDESALTGESVPVEKSVAPLAALDAPLPDRVNMVFAGTVVVEGSGLAIIVATGRETEMGHVRALVADSNSPATPLERELERVGRYLVGISLTFCGVTLGLGLLRGMPALEMLRTAISLAVAAVPEGLPAVATTTLALGMQRMLRHRMLVRRLAAVESLGATTVICADKTGTLTENRMTVAAWFVGGREYPVGVEGDNGIEADPALARALAIAMLCNEAEIGNGSAEIKGSSTEGALLVAAARAGFDYRAFRARHPLVTLRPRAEGDNWMATVHGDGGHRLMTVKGAPEEVLDRATSRLDGGHTVTLTPETKQSIRELNARVAARGMRVLGLAFKEIAVGADDSYGDLTWVGLVAFTDPIREGVREAILACRRAGIRPVILTGDQARTAAAIYRDLDPARNGHPRVVEASQLEGMDAAGWRAMASEVDIFARVSPAHKYHIVRALQASGHVVAMTGDGINDAAALRAADIGVAMGARGTDIARDVADIVLIDDDFGSIVRAVEQGRTIHRNISKALRFLLSTNFSEILVTLGALALGVARPMAPIQFLWINLLSDVFPALALALEEPEADVMSRPPRDPAEPILSPAVLREIAGQAAVLSASTLTVHGVALARYGAGAHATTIAFCTLTAAQLAHALGYRAHTAAGAAGLRKSPMLMAAVGGTLGLHVAAMTVPSLRRLLGITSLGAADWALVAGGVSAPLVLQEMKRWLASGRPAGARAEGDPRWHESNRHADHVRRLAPRGDGHGAPPPDPSPVMDPAVPRSSPSAS
ncbi:MAG TPA: cation-transporting P-type ATPase [Methylomirabilota bacterium]